jgi:hypothetical protein
VNFELRSEIREWNGTPEEVRGQAHGRALYKAGGRWKRCSAVLELELGPLLERWLGHAPHAREVWRFLGRDGARMAGWDGLDMCQLLGSGLVARPAE